MIVPRGHSTKRTTKPCAGCGATLSARTQEAMYQRVFTCQTVTADTSGGLPVECWINRTPNSVETIAALAAMSQVSKREDGSARAPSAAKRAQVVQRYIVEVGSGEPPISWYRDVLREHNARLVTGALATLPYWKQDKLRLHSLKSLGAIDKCVSRVRGVAGDNLADMLGAFVEHYYELMAFGFDNNLYGSANPVKISTLHQRIYKLANYLEWLSGQGHDSLREAGPSWLMRYITERELHPSAAYQISKFYSWVRKKHPFVPSVRYDRRGKSKYRTEFEVLKLDASREAYERICAHPEPQGRALALLALLYAQRTIDSISLKRADLKRDPDSGLWMIARPGAEPFRIEQELSEALDQCLALAEQHVRRLGAVEDEYIFPGRLLGHLVEEVGSKRIKAASGCSPNILRRTAVVNMFRGGEKTMGTVVLRDILNVSSKTIHKAIKMTGESVNSPMAREEADTLRRAFLDADDD